MVDDSAFGVETAETRARINTLVVDAGLGRSTVGIEDTFRFAALTGITKVLRETLTNSRTVLIPTFGIGSTRERYARIRSWSRSWINYDSCKINIKKN